MSFTPGQSSKCQHLRFSPVRPVLSPGRMLRPHPGAGTCLRLLCQGAGGLRSLTAPQANSATTAWSAGSPLCPSVLRRSCRPSLGTLRFTLGRELTSFLQLKGHSPDEAGWGSTARCLCLLQVIFFRFTPY